VTSHPSHSELPELAHPEAVARLFRENNDALVRFLRIRLRSEQEARDIAQEAYVRMLQLDRPGTVSFLKAYLFKTASNLATDRMRRIAVRSTLDVDPFLGMRPSTPPPDSATAARQEVELIRRFLDEVDEKPRQAFLLHKFADLSLEEVAARMGVTERMVRNYVVQALTHCRERLDQLQGRLE
jgi:RNA polymerase sigma factor (sigma-70 family)